MNKIPSFQITDLTVCGFKCFQEPQTFRFGGMNAITGHNGQGKSSIADAIAYAITGVPFFAGTGLDRLYTLDTKEVRVELGLIYPDGTAHRLIRSRVNDQTEITYDGITLRQADLTVMFGERDVFLSIFNPLYFIESLGDKGRNLLERHLPAVPHERVLEQLSEGHRTLLENVQIHAPEALAEKLRGEIRELESTIVYIEGQRDLLNAQGRERADLLVEKQEELAAARQRSQELEDKKKNGTDIAALQNRLSALVSAKEERQVSEFISPYTQTLADATARFEETKARYLQENATLSALRPGICCPTCKQEVTEGNLDAVKLAFSRSVHSLIEEGRQLKGQLEEIRALDAKALTVFRQFKADDQARLEAQRTEIAQLEQAIRMGGLTDAEEQILAAMHETVTQLEAEIGMLAPSDSAAQPADRQTDIDTLTQSIAQKRELEKAIKYYISTRVSMMFADFDMLQKVKILLYDIMKTTGEVKSTFKFTYDGRPYHYLSLSEKIKAGLELSELMKKLTGSDYPVFIDNGESVPIIDNIKPTGQVFIAQVVKAAPLTVQILDAPDVRKAA